MRVLLLDNYDSFVFNLYQMIGERVGRPIVRRNDESTLDEVEAIRPERIVISPGPGRPDDPAWFGIGAEVVRRFGPRVPILGVCLGHQGIVAALGGRIVRAPVPRHGKPSPIHHDGRGLFAGLPDPFPAMRYHSLIAERTSLPADLEMSAWTADGLVMGVRHRSWPLEGVQFHPESIGTPAGGRLLDRFLAAAG